MYVNVKSGLFSSVYIHPQSDIVMKICGNRDGNYEFYHFCLEENQPDNKGVFPWPHFPHIHAVQDIKKGSEKGYIAYMEKLTPFLGKQNKLNDFALETEFWKHLEVIHMFNKTKWHGNDLFNNWFDCIDVHTKNVLWRHNAKREVTLVITDPLC